MANRMGLTGLPASAAAGASSSTGSIVLAPLPAGAISRRNARFISLEVAATGAGRRPRQAIDFAGTSQLQPHISPQVDIPTLLEPNSGAAAAAEVLLPAFLQGSVDLASLRPEVALALQEARIILRAAQDRCTSVEHFLGWCQASCSVAAIQTVAAWAHQHKQASMLAAKLCRWLSTQSLGRTESERLPSRSRTHHDADVHATVSGMLASAWSDVNNMQQQSQHQPGLAVTSGRLSHAVFSSSIEDADSGGATRGTPASSNAGGQARGPASSSRRNALGTPHAYRGDSSGFYTAAAANGTLLRPSTPTSGPQQSSHGVSSVPNGASAYANNNQAAARQGLHIEQQDEQRRRVHHDDEAWSSMQQQGRSNSSYPGAQPTAPSDGASDGPANNGSAPRPEHADQGSIPRQPSMQIAGGGEDATSSIRRRRGLLQRPERSVSTPPEPPQGWQGSPAPPRPPPMPPAPTPGLTSYRRRSRQDYYDEDEDDGSDSEWQPPPPRRPPPQPRVARALPLQLIPMSPGAGTLLDPDTGRPLIGDSTSSNSNSSTARNSSSSSSRSTPVTGLALPLLGPWMLSNSRDKFPASDALVDYHPVTQHGIQQWLSMRLEYVPQADEQESEYEARIGDAITLPSQGFSGTPASSAWEGEGDRDGEFGEWGTYSRPARPDPIATLQLFNLSRRRRGSTEAATFFVYSPASEEEGRGRTQAAIRPGDPGFPLRPGDVITLGSGPDAPRFRVAVLGGGPRGSEFVVGGVLARYSGGLPLQTSGNRSIAVPSVLSDGELVTPNIARALKKAPTMTLAQATEAARTDPAAGDAVFRSLLAGRERSNTFAWIAWAQLAARRGRLRMARDLFRAAVATAAPASPGDMPGALEAAAAAAATEEGWQTEQQHQSTGQPSATTVANIPVMGKPTFLPPPIPPSYVSSTTGTSTSSQAAPAGAAAGQGVPPTGGAPGSVVALVQALYTWGRFEWSQKGLQGSARHLWRAAADVAGLHPAGPMAGGLNVILHSWASSELDRGNVLNARVIAAEALRKCPDDQMLYVLAAGVEHAGGDYELARTFCLRAYELDRTDKHLYIVWPKVMASLGEKDKARVLFERGLEYHPKNTKIMLAYAKFEAEQGDIDVAAELHERALEVDPTSETTMQNRVEWAQLEASMGNLSVARQLLEEGLELHPRFLQAHVALARVERLSGNLEEAQQILRKAAKFTHPFDVPFLKERATLYRALGERTLAASIEAHIKLVNRMLAEKSLGGLNTSAAWAQFMQESRQPARRKLSRAAARRKAELGWWSQEQGAANGSGEARVLDGVPGPQAARKDGPQWRPLPTPAYVREAYSQRLQQARAAAAAAESSSSDEDGGGQEPVLEVHQWRDEQVVVVYDHQHQKQHQRSKHHQEQEQQQEGDLQQQQQQQFHYQQDQQQDEQQQYWLSEHTNGHPKDSAVGDGEEGRDAEDMQQALFSRLSRRDAPGATGSAGDSEQQYYVNGEHHHASYTADDGEVDDGEETDPGQPLFARSMNKGSGNSSSSQSRDRGSQ